MPNGSRQQRSQLAGKRFPLRPSANGVTAAPGQSGERPGQPPRHSLPAFDPPSGRRPNQKHAAHSPRSIELHAGCRTLQLTAGTRRSATLCDQCLGHNRWRRARGPMAGGTSRACGSATILHTCHPNEGPAGARGNSLSPVLSPVVSTGPSLKHARVPPHRAERGREWRGVGGGVGRARDRWRRRG